MDDFENELRRTLDDRAAALPDTYDAPAEVLARARRRHTAKVGVLAVSIVLVVSGSVAAVAGVVGRDDTKQAVSIQPSASTTTATSPSGAATTVASREMVETVKCPVLQSIREQSGSRPPVTAPRAPAAGDPATLRALASYAGVAGARYTVMGPKTWSCLTQISTDGNNDVVLYPPASSPGRVPSLAEAPIAVDNDWLWHGGVGASTACSVFADPTVVEFVTLDFPKALPCPKAGRSVARVSAHAATFVDADGARGAGWIELPSPPDGADGFISVLSCRPTSALTTADCDTIVADWIARVDTGS